MKEKIIFMAKEHSFEMYGHPSIYNPKTRKLKIYFSEPYNGINDSTGILLLIAGFGGNANSNVYKKMRTYFSDNHNLVVVQCDYFGWEFMQKPNNISININKIELLKTFSKSEVNYIFQDNNFWERLLEVANKYNYNIFCSEILDENLSNFNDMGIMQAIDNISAVICIMEIIKDNCYKFNRNKIIIYGHSHGAYLAYLCNAFAPNLFSLIIDNSAWLFPIYLKHNRYVNSRYKNIVISTQYSYLARTLNYDEEILYLPFLYKKFKNNCNIICYHGTDDKLISNVDKKQFAKHVDKLTYNEISNDKIDNKVFRSTSHGLNADFIKMYDYVMENNKIDFDENKIMKLETVKYYTKERQYCIDYSNKIPHLTILDT